LLEPRFPRRLVDSGTAFAPQLRFFAGLSTPDAATALGISVATAERWWTFARAWLYSEPQGVEKKSFDL
jgi:hypothetical protein